jgi:hypothetical protein
MQNLPEPVKAYILQRMARRDPPCQIAACVQSNFHFEISRAEVIACWNDRDAPATQTGHRQNQQSMQILGDTAREPIAGRMAPAETRLSSAEVAPATEAVPANTNIAIHPAHAAGNALPTQTGHRQEQDAMQILGDEMREFIVDRIAHGETPGAAAFAATIHFGVEVGRAQALACWNDRQTRPATIEDENAMSTLTDEIKAFIVRGLARYETPTQVAAAVKAAFRVEIDRRQVFAYDPAGSRPPAQRWIDLHAATRAKFLKDADEIGIAHKAVRLQMLERFAQRCEENNCPERAAAFLEQAAKECGGFYESRRRRAPAVDPAPTETAPAS